MSDDGPLACPRCARKFPLSERFCPDCQMPLVYVGVGERKPITEVHEKAQKVNPEYVGGAPVKVAYASNQVEAELIQGILLEEGIPSTQRRARGFDVPDFLAAGPRDILVPEAAYDAARSLIYASPALGEPRSGPFEPEGERPARLLAGLLVALAAAAAIVYGLSRLVA